jgi:uncharacterized cupin superfamily protein
MSTPRMTGVWSVQLGQWRWHFRRLGVLTLVEGPDGGYAVLNQERSP